MRPSPAPTSRRTAPSPSLRRWLRTPSRTSRSLSRYSFAYLGSPPNRLSSSQRAHRSCSTMLRFSPSVLTRRRTLAIAGVSRASAKDQSPALLGLPANVSRPLLRRCPEEIIHRVFDVVVRFHILGVPLRDFALYQLDGSRRIRMSAKIVAEEQGVLLIRMAVYPHMHIGAALAWRLVE